MCAAVGKLLCRNSPIVNGLIYKSYSDKSEIYINSTNYQSELSEALANGFINEELDIIWTGTKQMKSINIALDKLKTFMNGGDLSDEFFDEYEEKYDAPMELQNKLFWEQVLNVDICFS